MKNTKILLSLFCLKFTMAVWGQYCNEADELFKLGRYSEAKNKYELCLRYDKTNETVILLQIKKADECDVWQKQGENYIIQKKWKNAFIYFDKIVGANPYDKKAKNRLDLCIEKGDIPNVKVETVYKTDTIIKTKTETVFIRDTIFIVMRDTTTILLPPPINNTLNLLPFGIHQFATKQPGKGIFFAGTQVGLLGTSLGYYISAQNNLKKNKSPEYEDWERDRFYDKYEYQRNLPYYFLAGAGVSILLNYFDNFNWFRKNNIALGTIPTFDWKGKPQIAMSVNIKF